MKMSQRKAKQPDYLEKALEGIKEISMTALGQAEARERILLKALKNIGSWFYIPKEPDQQIAMVGMKKCAAKALEDRDALKYRQEQG